MRGYTAGGLPATQGADGPGGLAQRFAHGADVPAVWWQVFRSRQIEAFVREAIDNHPDLAAAQAALRQAREVAAADTSALLPSITGEGSATRSQVPLAQSGQTGPSSLYTLYKTSVPVSFTPDIFGGKARGIEADLANADYQRFQLEATYLSLTANVVTTAISDASYAAQIRVTQEQIDGQRQLVALLEQQFALGAVANSDVLTPEGPAGADACDAAAAAKVARAGSQPADGLSRPVAEPGQGRGRAAGKSAPAA